GLGGGVGGGGSGGTGGYSHRRARGGGGARASGEPTVELVSPEPGTVGGRMEARTDGQMVGEFPLKHTGVAAKVSGSSARTVVTQTFSNTFDSTIEAHYTFPLPGDAAVNGFIMQVGERRTL